MRATVAAGLAVLLSAADPAAAVQAPVYAVTLVTDAAPDFTDVRSYLASITAQWPTPQDKAIAIWRWSHRLRKQASVPAERGDDVRDPILFFTSYGYTNCGIISGVNNALWLNLGWRARYDQIEGHTVSECSWDGGRTFHMFDDSMSFYCFNARGEVASTPEIGADPSLYLERAAPECATNPVRDLRDQAGWRAASDHPVEYARTLANGADSFTKIHELLTDHLAIQWGRGYALDLRPNESYTRFFRPLDGDPPDPAYFRPASDGRDPVGGEVRGAARANGVWTYAPDLTDPGTRELVDAAAGGTWGPDGVRGPGSVTFKVNAANVVTSARLSWTATGASAAVSVDAGTHWHPFPTGSSGGPLPDLVAGETGYLVRATLAGTGSRLAALRLETVTQLNRPALPGLRRGRNRVQVRLGPQEETTTLAPGLGPAQESGTLQADVRPYLDTAWASGGVAVNPRPYFNVATLAPAAAGVTAFVTWKVAAPGPITGVTYGGNVCVKAWDGNPGWAALDHSWDGVAFAEDFREAGNATPYDRVVRAETGPAPDGGRTVWLRYRFATAGDPAKVWQSPGIASVLMTVRSRPRVAGPSPLVVTYDWVEHGPGGDVERRHTERVDGVRHDYVIDVGGTRDPDVRWVRVNLAGSSPDREPERDGYADGRDAGPGPARVPTIYRWGRNLARGRPYALAGPVDERNPDGGRDLTDGIVAPPETAVSAKWMPTNVMFRSDAPAAVTVDLGAIRPVAAIRVHAGASKEFHLTYPDRIRVETSADGKAFAPAGEAGFDQVFDPPADFEDWERADALAFADQPAGGRLAYAYRVLLARPARARFVRVRCDPRPGWGQMLSEVEVLDAVTSRTVPPAVVLAGTR